MCADANRCCRIFSAQAARAWDAAAREHRGDGAKTNFPAGAGAGAGAGGDGPARKRRKTDGGGGGGGGSAKKKAGAPKKKKAAKKEADETQWVQCDACKQWRILAPGMDAGTLPDTWKCADNTWFPGRAGCSTPEDKEINLRQYVAYAKLLREKEAAAAAT